MIKHMIFMGMVIFMITACQTNGSAKKVAKDAVQAKTEAVTVKQVLVKKSDVNYLSAKNKGAQEMFNNAINTQGMIHYLNFEGGFYGIVTDSGQKLLPLNLAKKYQQNGAVVKIKAELNTGIMTIQQWGTPIKITNIELIKSRNVPEQ